MSLNLKHVRYFLAAAHAGQISRAAVELNVSQSAVTAAVQQLEKRLGVQLFERRMTGVTLTAVGARFMRQAENVASAVDDALRVAGETWPQPRGRVTIGVTYTVSGYFMPRMLLQLQRICPDLSLVVTEYERKRLEDDLTAGRIDLAVMLTSNLERHDTLAHVTLARSPRRLWTSAEHPLSNATSVSLSEIAQLPYIALTADEALDTSMKYWEKTPYRPNVTFATGSVEAVRTMVAAGMGVSILSDLVYRPWSLEGQRISRQDVADIVPTMDLGVAWRAQAEPSEAAAAVIAVLTDMTRSGTSRPGSLADGSETVGSGPAARGSAGPNAHPPSRAP